MTDDEEKATLLLIARLTLQVSQLENELDELRGDYRMANQFEKQVREKSREIAVEHGFDPTVHPSNLLSILSERVEKTS